MTQQEQARVLELARECGIGMSTTNPHLIAATTQELLTFYQRAQDEALERAAGLADIHSGGGSSRDYILGRQDAASYIRAAIKGGE